jgi:capsular exopolysaccharide synthesis family protein
VSNIKGLTEVLSGEKNLNETIRKYSNNLDILTSGSIPPNPAEMLASKAMSELLQVLKNTYDIIILDSSPIKVVADAQILSAKVDGTILVVKKDATKIESVKDSKNLLNKVGANIIGSILNGIGKPKKKESSYYSKKQIIVEA